MSTVKLEKHGPLMGVCATREEAERSGASWCQPGAYGNPHSNGIAAIVDEIKRADGVTVYGVWLGVQRP